MSCTAIDLVIKNIITLKIRSLVKDIPVGIASETFGSNCVINLNSKLITLPTEPDIWEGSYW